MKSKRCFLIFLLIPTILLLQAYSVCHAQNIYDPYSALNYSILNSSLYQTQPYLSAGTGYGYYGYVDPLSQILSSAYLNPLANPYLATYGYQSNGYINPYQSYDPLGALGFASAIYNPLSVYASSIYPASVYTQSTNGSTNSSTGTTTTGSGYTAQANSYYPTNYNTAYTTAQSPSIQLNPYALAALTLPYMSILAQDPILASYYQTPLSIYQNSLTTYPSQTTTVNPYQGYTTNPYQVYTVNPYQGYSTNPYQGYSTNPYQVYTINPYQVYTTTDQNQNYTTNTNQYTSTSQSSQPSPYYQTSNYQQTTTTQPTTNTTQYAVSGNWTGTWFTTLATGEINSGSAQLTLTQIGVDLTGTVKFLSNGYTKLSCNVNGKINGSVISLLGTLYSGSIVYNLNINGNISANNLSGTYSITNNTGTIVESGTFNLGLSI